MGWDHLKSSVRFRVTIEGASFVGHCRDGVSVKWELGVITTYRLSKVQAFSIDLVSVRAYGPVLFREACN